MIGLGLGLTLSAARAQIFDPASLFTSGEIGWVEPMLPGVTLFQDAAGTIPVTAPGQPVGLSKFTAGGQIGFVQPTALNRPIYQVDAQGRGYLAHNGVNQWMQTASAVAWGSDKVTVCTGVRKDADPSYGTIFDVSGAWSVNNGTWVLATRSSPAGWLLFQRGTSTLTTVAATGSAPETALLTGIIDTSAPITTLRKNGAQASTSPTSTGGIAFGTYPIYAGSNAPGSALLNGRRYPSMAINRKLTADELAQIEAWVNARTGAY